MLLIGRALITFALFYLVASAVSHATSTSPIGVGGSSSLVGFWVTPDGDWVVEIQPCPSGFCGQLVGLKASHRPNALRMDLHNPSPARRNRPLCGLLLMGSFKPSKDDSGKWGDGWVYDPESGETYSGRMWLDGPNRLKLRGYVLLSLFGRSETLTRETGPINRCPNVPVG